MSNNRLHRIEETLRRAIADHLLFGGLRDPRLQGVNIGVTGVRVTPDLMQARVFIDVLGDDGQARECLAALQAATPAIRAEISRKIHLRRLPQIRFERDSSIEHGLRIERALAEIRAQETVTRSGDEGAGEGES